MSLVCPNCNYKMEGHMNMTTGKDEVPENGDVTMCFGCSYFFIFENGSLRRLTTEEFEQFDDETKVNLITMQSQWRQHRQAR